MVEGPRSSRPVVVVADDDKSTCDHIASVLRSAKFVVIPVYGGQKAVDAVRARRVDLVILDVGMPGLGGIDACRVIKTITEGTFVPVMLLTVQDDLNDRVQGRRTGADDHIAKPVDDATLLAQVDNMVRVKRAHDDVRVARSKLRHASLHEQLKALPDHRDFHERLKREFEAAARQLDPMACCIIAIEDFRRIAKDQGPDRASQVLDVVSTRLQETAGEDGIVAQFRTAEFGLLLPKTSPALALALADEVVKQVAHHAMTFGDETLNIQIAVGLGLYPSAGVRSHSELLDAASIAVARARVAGPNSVCVVQHQGYVFRPTLTGAA